MNCYSVNLATGTQNLFTGAKLIAIFIVITGGLVRIAQGEVKYISSGFEGSKSSFSDIATAFYSKFFAAARQMARPQMGAATTTTTKTAATTTT